MEEVLAKKLSVSADWSDFYRNYFEIFSNKDFHYLRKTEAGQRHLIVDERLDMELLIKVISRHFKVDCDPKYKEIFSRNARTPLSTYSIIVWDNDEADHMCRNLSVNDLWYKRYSGLTLIERLLLELKHYSETGEHLDRKLKTICSGSWTKQAEFPTVFWDEERDCLVIGMIEFNDRDHLLSARLVLN